MGVEKILITGGSGLLGSKIANLASKGLNVTATYNKHPIKGNYKSISMDITIKEEVKKILKKRPEWVIHTAALTNVDYCENRIKKKRHGGINVKETSNVAQACEEIEAKLVYISTDFVFDGKMAGIKRKICLHLLNYYSKTKLDAERIIEKLDVEHVIVRVSVLYGWNVQQRLNFVTWINRRIRQ